MNLAHRMTPAEIGWLAGLLEGEGCFSLSQDREYIYPVVRLQMTDEDVVRQAAFFMQTPVHGPRTNGRWKPVFSTTAWHARAVGVMYTVYTFMCSRRKAKIVDLISRWKVEPSRKGYPQRVWRSLS